MWVLIECVWPYTLEDEEEYVSSGTPGQRALYSATLFAREVDNGGLEQFLWNAEPWFVDLTLEGLATLGAVEQGGALREAIHRFFGDSPPEDWEDRRAIIDGYDRAWRKQHIEPLNERVYGESRLYPLFKDLVAARPGDFYLD